MQFVSILWLRPGLRTNPRNGCGVELAEIGSFLRIQPAPAVNGLGSPLLQRGVVEESVWSSREYFSRQRRRLDTVAGYKHLLVALHGSQQMLQAIDIHRFFQTVAQRLLNQRVVRDLALAAQILSAGQLVREDSRNEIFSV